MGGGGGVGGKQCKLWKTSTNARFPKAMMEVQVQVQRVDMSHV